MNIIIITDSYYPEMAATAACLDKFIQKLKVKYHFDIIDLLNRTISEPLNDSSIKVHHVSNFLWKLRIRCADNIRNGKWIYLSKIVILLFKIKSLLMINFTYPSSASWSLNAYYLELERINTTKKIDVIISLSDPICCSLAALKFKKRHPKVKWINYFMDPFTLSPSKYRYLLFKEKRKRKNYKTEKEIYDHADLNLLTEEIYKLALSEFKQPKSKTFSTKYVLSKISEPTFMRTGFYRENEINLVYAGMFLKDKRNPKRCLSVLSQVSGITFDMFVRYSNCDRDIAPYLSPSIRQHPSVDRKRYEEIISNEYDILVNIGNNFSLQIPSKMLELLSTGRPIINFYQLKDVHYEMIEKYPLGINIGPDDIDAVERVSDFCQRMKGRRMAFEEVEKLFPENTLDNQLALLERLIEA